jgi:hypothetical protein
MFTQTVLVALLAALAEARFGQEQGNGAITAIGALTDLGTSGQAATLAGGSIQFLLAAANPCGSKSSRLLTWSYTYTSQNSPKPITSSLSWEPVTAPLRLLVASSQLSRTSTHLWFPSLPSARTLLFPPPLLSVVSFLSSTQLSVVRRLRMPTLPSPLLLPLMLLD